MRKNVIIGIIAALLTSGAALAADFPNKPITVIIGYPPGGTNDIVARSVAEEMSISLGQPVVIENVPGATGLVGMKQLVSSEPDGYTIGLGAPPILAIKPALSDDPIAELGFNHRTDVAPVALLTQIPFMVAINKDLPVTSFEELVKYSQDNPGELSYGTNGVGGTSHLIGEMLARGVGLDAVHIPYKGDPEFLTALLSNEVQIGYPTAATGALAQVEQGNLLPLALTGEADRLPDLPQLSDFPGMEGFGASVWFGVFAPAGVPEDILETLNAEINKALASQKVIDVYQTSGLVPRPLSLSDMRSFVTAEQDRWDEYLANLDIELSN